MKNLHRRIQEVPQLQQKYAKASCRKGHRRKTETERCLARAFAAECGKPRDAERLHPSRRCLGVSAARRWVAAWNDRLRPGPNLHSSRAAPAWKLPTVLPRKKYRPKRMNHKNYRRLRLITIPRHTASMFLSPVSFALRTLPLR